MAMTAWSAKVLRRAMCLSEKGGRVVRRIKIAPDGGILAQQRRRHNRTNTVAFAISRCFRKLLPYFRCVVNVNHLSVNDGSPYYRTAVNRFSHTSQVDGSMMRPQNQDPVLNAEDDSIG